MTVDRVMAVAPCLVLGLVFSCCAFKYVAEKNLWRWFAVLCVLGSMIMIALGSAGIVVGCILPLMLPLAYFGALEYRQFSLADALLYTLILASVGTAAARMCQLP